jgi:hypothetical protein
MDHWRPPKSAVISGRGSQGNNPRLFSPDHVHDEEGLYRHVRNDPHNFAGEGVDWRVSQAAFGDRSRKPSVDRAWLKDYDPRNSQHDSTDCVVCLVANDVRTVKDISPREVDVVPDPVKDHQTEPDNPAHALVVTVPALDNNSQFKRLKKALAKRCTVMIMPGGTTPGPGSV